MGQEVIFAVHGDGPVGLDGPRVELDDERVVLTLGGVGGDARDVSAGFTLGRLRRLDALLGEACGRVK
jgi:hypothetical protein